jgi:hypothetical protein
MHPDSGEVSILPRLERCKSIAEVRLEQGQIQSAGLLKCNLPIGPPLASYREFADSRKRLVTETMIAHHLNHISTATGGVRFVNQEQDNPPGLWARAAGNGCCCLTR